MKTTVYKQVNNYGIKLFFPVVFKKLFIYFLLMLCMSYQLHASEDRIKGNGKLKTETRTISAFNEIHVSHAVKVVITKDDNYSLKIEGDENLLPYVEIHEKGNSLDIGMK